VVVAKQDIPTPADMKGRIWGNSSEAGVTVVIRTAFFEKHGLNYETDVRSVTTGSSSASMQAFAAGQLDVGLLHPDQAATLMEKNPGKFHIIYYTYEAVQLINDVWYGNKAWVEQNPEMTQAISLASIIAARWAYADKDAFLALSKEYVPDFSEQVISDSYDILAGQVKLWEANGGLSQDSCESAMAVSVSAGAVEEAVDCSSLLDTSFQERSLTILGAQ
jgi:ABC-type nitrate/sulfonate/bicarbonate transport system substrate-binding protein